MFHVLGKRQKAEAKGTGLPDELLTSHLPATYRLLIFALQKNQMS